jgi:hypothetical protein
MVILILSTKDQLLVYFFPNKLYYRFHCKKIPVLVLQTCQVNIETGNSITWCKNRQICSPITWPFPNTTPRFESFYVPTSPVRLREVWL